MAISQLLMDGGNMVVIYHMEDLTRIPYQEIQWYHAVAPGILAIIN